MTDVVETQETETEESEGDVRDRPRLRLMPRDDLEVGPFFPSGTNSVEMGFAGALDISGNEVDFGDRTDDTFTGVDTDDDSAGELNAGSSYDPGANTIDAVLAYVDENPDEVDSVLEAEQAGKNRSTLIQQLEARQA